MSSNLGGSTNGSTDITSQAYALHQDSLDPLRHLRKHFLIPSKADLSRKTLKKSSSAPNGESNGVSKSEDDTPSVYLCGNSLGLQPTLTATYLSEYLSTWATKGVYGHFKEIEDSSLAPWLHVDDDVVEDMAAVVGALPSEVAVMQTLTANLHLMMASFYRPTKDRFKILLEGKAFPSDHYAAESHIRHHDHDPKEAMVLIEPASKSSPLLPTEHILSIIDTHASQTALLLLPGVQFYTGQFFDIQKITAHAQSKGITVGWDLAHAVGNVPLALHDHNVDFAVWCTYKYLNCGPGSIGGCFVHERHGTVTDTSNTEYTPRLSGWWGSAKAERFAMENRFCPTPGAAGWQLSNPSVADTTAVRASLDVFKTTSISALRAKSLALTGYLEDLLDKLATTLDCFCIITPKNRDERGAQLSVRLREGLLEGVMAVLEREGVVVDERRPDVVRVAPAPMYNSFEDVRVFVEVFGRACKEATGQGVRKGEGSEMMEKGRGEGVRGEVL